MLPGYKEARRFYKKAEVEELSDGGRVLLDGRPLRTPLRAELRLPTLALAEAVVAEWQSQGEKIDVATMPMMSLACTALDRVARNRQAIEQQLLSYGANDLLCYWAEGPEALVERQRRYWQPVLDWAEKQYSARFSVCRGILHRPQSEKTLKCLQGALSELDDFQMAALSSAVAASSSLLVGLALLQGRLDSEMAFCVAELDSLYQQKFWGSDQESKERQEGIKKEIQDVEDFISLIKLDKN